MKSEEPTSAEPTHGCEPHLPKPKPPDKDN